VQYVGTVLIWFCVFVFLRWAWRIGVGCAAVAGDDGPTLGGAEVAAWAGLDFRYLFGYRPIDAPPEGPCQDGEASFRHASR
jgi:hypothetical protein